MKTSQGRTMHQTIASGVRVIIFHLGLLMLSTAGYSQEIKLNPGVELSPEQLENMRMLFEREASKRPTSFSYQDLQGSFSINASCPAGYANSAQYRFSTPNITITADEGAGCNELSQCSSWHIAAEPNDPEEVFQFTMRLNCSSEDAFRVTTDSRN